MPEVIETLEILDDSELTLLEILDHVLNRGIVIAGEITISVADIDLIFLGLNAVLTSVETANEVLGRRLQGDASRRSHSGSDNPS